MPRNYVKIGTANFWQAFVRAGRARIRLDRARAAERLAPETRRQIAEDFKRALAELAEAFHELEDGHAKDEKRGLWLVQLALQPRAERNEK